MTRKNKYQAVRAGSLVAADVRRACSRLGFAETRILTHWAEIVGADLAHITRPVKVSYAKGGFGATLIVGCVGAMAPMIDLRREEIRTLVNACYGYNAIARVRIRQVSPAELQAPEARPAPPTPPLPTKGGLSQTVANPDLKAALAQLEANLAARRVSRKDIR